MQDGYNIKIDLEKWSRRCAYCGAENVPLEIDHSNLTLACRDCNVKKGSRPVEEFLSRRPKVAVLTQAKAPLRDAAAANATRRALRERFGAFVLSVECGSGGRTKHNRTVQGYRKAHWIDAACVGESGGRRASGTEHEGTRHRSDGSRVAADVPDGQVRVPADRDEGGSDGNVFKVWTV